MIIDHNSSILGGAANSAARSKASVPAQSGSATQTQSTNNSVSSHDSVSLSSKGQTIAKLEASLESISDVDAGRVQELRTAIGNGNYSVNAEAIAEKFLSQDAEL
ncbi:MAG: negative regulator of flagellin synthesis FlgM [Flavobacteriales bacterium]|jgi:negative regulator of flagellin synthesis FlgM